jgi:hypothetical protein
MAEKKKDVKPEKSVTLAIGVPGRKAHVTHKVSKDKKGDVVVEHTNVKLGKYDKINLTNKAGSKSVSQGVKAVKTYHKQNPHRKQGR